VSYKNPPPIATATSGGIYESDDEKLVSRRWLDRLLDGLDRVDRSWIDHDPGQKPVHVVRELPQQNPELLALLGLEVTQDLADVLRAVAKKIWVQSQRVAYARVVEVNTPTLPVGMTTGVVVEPTMSRNELHECLENLQDHLILMMADFWVDTFDQVEAPDREEDLMHQPTHPHASKSAVLLQLTFFDVPASLPCMRLSRVGRQLPAHLFVESMGP